MTSKLILVGRVAGAFGVKGEVRVTAYTESPQALLDYRDLPEDAPLNPIAARQRLAVQAGRPIIESSLSSALAIFLPPVGYLDFETVALPIPCWNGCRPYDQVPVQFSFDVDTGPDGFQHAEWIADGSADPRAGIAAALVDGPLGAAET